MNKKWIGIGAAGATVCVGAVLFAIFGIHRHEWTAADCVNPETCLECGETRGEALGHTWQEATCTEAAACSVCGETRGEALGHTWQEATCTEASTCSVCGETEGEALGHSWSEANYQAASTCSVCGETEGEPLTPWFEEKKLSCGSGENGSFEYVTSTMEDSEEKTVGRVIMSEYRTFESDRTHAAREGYEWISAKFELLFSDRNSWQHGCAVTWLTTDYYNPELCEKSEREPEEAGQDTTEGNGSEQTAPEEKSGQDTTEGNGSEQTASEGNGSGQTASEGNGSEQTAPEGNGSGQTTSEEKSASGEAPQTEDTEEGKEDRSGITIQYTVNYNGQDYDQCLASCSNPEQKETDYAAYIMTFEAAFRVPKGYDGAVIAFFDPMLETENSSQDPENSEDTGEGEESSEGSGEGEDTSEETGEEEPKELTAPEILTRGVTSIRLRETGAEREESEGSENSEDSRDSGAPRMTVLRACIPVQPGTVLESASVIWGDTDCQAGFYDLHKTGELEDFDMEQFWNQAPIYEETVLSEETELSEELEIPQEEGIYSVRAAVRNGAGKAGTAELFLVVDGTAPKVHVSKERVTLRNGDIFVPMEGVYGEDSFWAQEDCFITIDIEELQNLADRMQRGRAGTYKLTYYATDLAGNMGSKTISVTLSAGGGGSGQQRPDQGSEQTPDQGGGNGGQGGGDQQTEASGGDGGQTEYPSWGGQENAQEAQFMDSMAREALGIVNGYRADAGLEALAWNDSLYESAKIRAQELVISFSHTRPDGSSCFTAMSGFSTCAENIACNFVNAESVCNGWYNSEGHRNNMLNASLTQAAIACWYQDGSYYWVNLFGG